MLDFTDPKFQDVLLRSLCRDRDFLDKADRWVDAKLFEPVKPQHTEQFARWVIASVALSHWQSHGRPVGDLLSVLTKRYAKVNHTDSTRAEALAAKVALVDKRKTRSGKEILKLLEGWTKETVLKRTMQELTQKWETGELTLRDLNAHVRSASTLALEVEEEEDETIDYLNPHTAELSYVLGGSVAPALLIEPLDQKLLYGCIDAGQLGVVMGPTKSGKSLLLAYIALALAVQGRVTLFFALEMGIKMQRERFDCMLSRMSKPELAENRKKFLRRKNDFQMRVMGMGGSLRLYGRKIGSVEEIIETVDRVERSGTKVGAVVIDYDKQLYPKGLPSTANSNQEYFKIYKGLRDDAKEKKYISWIGAQTRRDTKSKQVVTVDDISDGIAKMQEADFVLGVGKSPWGTTARHLYVSASRITAGEFGVDVMCDLPHLKIYDHDATMKRLAEEVLAADEEAAADAKPGRKKRVVQ